MTIVAIFGQPILQGLRVLAQAVHLFCVLLEQRLLPRNEFVSLRQPFSQHLISSRTAISSSSIVMVLLYSLCTRLASPLRTWTVTMIPLVKGKQGGKQCI